MNEREDPLYIDSEIKFDRPTANRMKDAYAFALSLRENHIRKENIIDIMNLLDDRKLHNFYVNMFSKFDLGLVKNGFDKIVEEGKEHMIKSKQIPKNYRLLKRVSNEVQKIMYYYYPTKMNKQIDEDNERERNGECLSCNA